MQTRKSFPDTTPSAATAKKQAVIAQEWSPELEILIITVTFWYSQSKDHDLLPADFTV